MLKEFKAFIMKGNVLELAVVVIIVGVFGVIVKLFMVDVIMLLIGFVLGGVDFFSFVIVFQEGVFNDVGEFVQEEVVICYGIFIQWILDFVIIVFIVFMIIWFYNCLMEKKEVEEVLFVFKGFLQEELLVEIRDLFKK